MLLGEKMDKKLQELIMVCTKEALISTIVVVCVGHGLQLRNAKTNEEDPNPVKLSGECHARSVLCRMGFTKQEGSSMHV